MSSLKSSAIFTNFSPVFFHRKEFHLVQIFVVENELKKKIYLYIYRSILSIGIWCRNWFKFVVGGENLWIREEETLKRFYQLYDTRYNALQLWTVGNMCDVINSADKHIWILWLIYDRGVQPVNLRDAARGHSNPNCTLALYIYVYHCARINIDRNEG